VLSGSLRVVDVRRTFAEVLLGEFSADYNVSRGMHCAARRRASCREISITSR
jgi:hypothetical protein